MSFCRFSPSFALHNKTIVDNTFINDYLPFAPEKCGQAYLLGLMLCSTLDDNNTLAFIAKKLEISEEDVISIFKYWEEKGLVQLLSTDPVEVRYLPVQNASAVKLYDTQKYTNFNLQLQALFGKTMLMAYDYQEYYYLIEHKHMEQDAIIEIVRYSIEYKGFNPSKTYSIRLVRDWEKEGIHTLNQVKAKIDELGLIDDNVSTILRALGTNRRIKLEDKELLNKWINMFGFEMNVILHIINNLKDKKRVFEMDKLDKTLTKYYEMKLMSVAEIDAYEKEKENYYFIAIEINKQLGIYYEDLTKEIDTYVVNWINMGFDVSLLKMVADNCFKSSIRTLDGFNNILTKLFRLGITNISAYNEYLADNMATDESIKKILQTLNLSRNVNNQDRAFYSIWTKDWGFTSEVITYAATLSTNKANAMQYLNKILSNWNSAGTKTLDSVKMLKVEEPAKEQAGNQFIHNNYTKEQIASFLTNLDDVEV